MSDTENAPAVCCENHDPETARLCAICEAPICKNCRVLVNRQKVCPSCQEKVAAELEAEKAGGASLPLAVAGGLGGALLGGVIWAVVAAVTDFEVGYVALAVGALAGYGTVFVCGGKKGQLLQIVAAACSIVGLLLGKYFCLAYFIKKEIEEDISYFDPEILRIFTEYIGELLSPFDILWLVLAIGIAWKIPRATQVSMGMPKGRRGARR